MIEVVAALIWNGDKFLICQRPETKARALLWEFVGGKVEPGESREQALERECREELDIGIRVNALFDDVVHEYPDLTIHLSVFFAVITKGTPQLLEHHDMKWISVEEIDQYHFCPADENILLKIKEYSHAVHMAMDFLKSAGTYYLGTVEDGKPRVRPFGTVDFFDGFLLFQTGKSKKVSKQLHQNPWFEICAFSQGHWIRIAGKAMEYDSRDARIHLLNQYPSLRAMYHEDDNNTELFSMTDCDVSLASFQDAPVNLHF